MKNTVTLARQNLYNFPYGNGATPVKKTHYCSLNAAAHWIANAASVNNVSCISMIYINRKCSKIRRRKNVGGCRVISHHFNKSDSILHSPKDLGPCHNSFQLNRTFRGTTNDGITSDRKRPMAVSPQNGWQVHQPHDRWQTSQSLWHQVLDVELFMHHTLVII